MHGRHDHLHASVASGQGIGHNHEHPEAAQWQTPHLPHDHAHTAHANDEHQDLDLVEKAFVQAFTGASDPTSFLRLADVVFEGTNDDGKRLTLLRVEQSQSTDIGSVTPHLGGESYRYDPLPAKLVSRRDQLGFVYFDGSQVVTLNLQEAKGLTRTDDGHTHDHHHET
ncbi:MAG: hypothetical protein AAGB04_14850 [Pseudomonadota bacterium]